MKKIELFFITTILAFTLLFLPQSVDARDSDGDIVVIIDAGHGGRDPGASNVCDSSQSEAILNWNIATALKAELETYSGVKVYLTRGSAEWNSNSGRAWIGKKLCADIVISCHNNSSTDSSVNGVTVYGTYNSKYRSQMKTLSEMIAANVSSLGLKNRGYANREGSTPGRDYYTLLDEAARDGVGVGIPGIIIEHCFISNSSDAAFISNISNQYKCGAADAQAIAAYYGLNKRGVKSGSEITLQRTYSAYMQTNIPEGRFKSSNEGVAHVREDGLITATGEGNAVITCTGTDGKEETVSVTVPKVKMMAIGAGIAKTFYENAASYLASDIMVKAVYSDGSVTQVTGYSIGNFPAQGNEKSYDIPISYNGLSCNLRIYGYNVNGPYTPANVTPTGSNKDILILPGNYNGITSGNVVTETSTTEYPSSDSQNETTTEVTTTETETIEETTEAVTTVNETTTETETTVEEEKTTEAVEETGVNGVKTLPIWPFLAGGLIIIAGSVTGILFLVRKLRR